MKLLSLIVAAVFVVLAIVLTLSVANSTSQLTVTSAVAVSPFRPDHDTDQLGYLPLSVSISTFGAGCTIFECQ